MLREWTEESERIEVQEKLEYLVEFLSERSSWENPHEYCILEYFPLDKPEPYTPNIYRLCNLVIDTIEDGIIIFSDIEGILEESMYNNTSLPLHQLLVDDIIYIGFKSDNMIVLSLDYGYIMIKY
jgi:alpha-amylase/alpha-mannosidase (GH57 family)